MKGMHRNGMPERILDALETDGGWLTLEGIRLVVGGQVDTVRKALHRLRVRGLVERRVIELVGRSFHSGWSSTSRVEEARTEWRAV